MVSNIISRKCQLNLFYILIIMGISFPVLPAKAQSSINVLVFTKTHGWRHTSIPDGIDMLQTVGTQRNWNVTHTEDSTLFNDTDLAIYDVVVFLSTSGNDILNSDQKAAFERYIQAGGGFAGIHSASDTEYHWPWYGGLVGTWFQCHPDQQPADLHVEIQDHPSTSFLPLVWTRFDEWYRFQMNPRSNVNVLLTIDESTYGLESCGGMGADHPMAWYQEYDGGRSFYTALGHTSDSFTSDGHFRDHVAGGIEWAAGNSGLAPGLLAHYPCDGNATDSSGNSNDGTIQGGAGFNSGIINQAIVLDGIDDTIHLPFLLDPSTTSFSVFAWVKGGTSNRIVLSQQNGAGIGQNILGIDNQGFLFTDLRPVSGSGLTASSMPVDPNSWTHVGLVWNETQRTFYVNSQVAGVDSSNIGNLESADGTWIIGSNNSGSNLFDGMLDDVRIYNQVISQSQILELIDLGPPTPNPAQFIDSPRALGQTSVTMTAQVGQDLHSPVEYNFTETSGNSGGSNSGWQILPTYVDNGLQSGTAYTYSVAMRDALGKETTASNPETVYTHSSPDVNSDNVVNMLDLGILSARWAESGCYQNNLCDHLDLDGSGAIDQGDLKLLASSWLSDLLPVAVGWFGFENNAVNSIGGNDGQEFGNPSYSAGKVGQAINLDGLNDYVSIPQLVSEDFTIAFWVNTSDSGDTGQWWVGKGMVDSEKAGAHDDFGITLTDSEVAFGIGNPDLTITSTTAINNGLWHHVALTRNNTTGEFKIFINGSQQAAAIGPTGPRDGQPRHLVGSMDTSSGKYLNGLIDELYFFDFILSHEQIQLLANP